MRARRLRLSSLTAGATLRIQDSLQAGKSRFYAEITRIRQIVEQAQGPVPLLFLLDEILHGTNSHDRRLGAEAVVRVLLDRGAIGLVTTHDLALARLADDNFSPTCMRNATAYGASPRLRLDVVLNDFVAAAYTSGRIYIKSDGTPWRPIVHIRDIIADVENALQVATGKKAAAQVAGD